MNVMNIVLMTLVVIVLFLFLKVKTLENNVNELQIEKTLSHLPGEDFYLSKEEGPSCPIFSKERIDQEALMVQKEMMTRSLFEQLQHQKQNAEYKEEKDEEDVPILEEEDEEDEEEVPNLEEDEVPDPPEIVQNTLEAIRNIQEETDPKEPSTRSGTEAADVIVIEKKKQRPKRKSTP